MTQTVTTLLSTLTILAQVLSLVLVVALVVGRRRPPMGLTRLAGRHGVLLAFVVSLLATLGSLYYSEVANFAPCLLCWYQRILMYPQVILLTVAYFAQDRGVVKYVLPLCLTGAGFAIYHYALQLGAPIAAPCEVVGYSASCAERFVLQFGYITIPLMAFSAFVLNALLLVAVRRVSRSG